jgi:hypothetical protein
MVRVHCGPTEYKHAGATVALTGRAPSDQYSCQLRGREGLLFPVLGRVIVANEVREGSETSLDNKSPIQAIRHVER